MHDIAQDIALRTAEQTGVADVAASRLLTDLESNIEPVPLIMVPVAAFTNPPSGEAYDAAHGAADLDEQEAFDAANVQDQFDGGRLS